MTNKQQIEKLKDNAELAQAAYGYFDLIGKKFKDRQDEQGEALIITQTDILDITYNSYITSEHTTLINPEKLKGDFAHFKQKDSLKDMIYSFISLIQNPTFLMF